jgi:hypothetical protein
MHFIRRPVIILIALFLCGCNSNTVEPIEIQSSEMLRISGALNATLYADETQYQCQGAIKSWEIGNTLILSIRADKNSVMGNEQTTLYLYMPLGSDEKPLSGKYYTHLLSDNLCGVTYKNHWSKNSFSKYRFETGLARVIIEQYDNNHLIGKFSLKAQQSFGQRVLHGNTENIKLVNNGKITVSGKIDVMLEV